jgi:mRNA interferase MazF
MVLLEQIRTIDKRRLLEYVGRVTLDEMSAIERALLVSVGIDAKNEAEER